MKCLSASNRLGGRAPLIALDTGWVRLRRSTVHCPSQKQWLGPMPGPGSAAGTSRSSSWEAKLGSKRRSNRVRPTGPWPYPCCGGTASCLSCGRRADRAGEVAAMIGDGVNDGQALAHPGQAELGSVLATGADGRCRVDVSGLILIRRGQDERVLSAPSQCR
jgi:hypothetical protein